MIEVKNLFKSYGKTEAVKDVSFTVESGKIYGFLGPNGAGKSTTMNIITGCLAPTHGEVKINGYDIYEDADEAKKFIGYLPEQPPLYTDMTPLEYLEFVGRAKKLRGAELERAVDEAMEKTNIKGVCDRLIKNLSKGYKQRVGIAQAILGDPEIIILDEPTVGLDPLQIIEIRELIKELGRDHTVILSSHILPEISEVCDYVIIIAKGEVVASDTIENLTQMFEGSGYIDIDARGDKDKIESALESLENIRGFDISDSGEGEVHIKIEVDRGVDVRENVFFLFCDMRLPIISMAYEETTLEKVFLSLTDNSDGTSGSHQETDKLPEGEEENIEPSDDGPDADADDAGEENTGSKDDDDEYKPLFGGSN